MPGNGQPDPHQAARIAMVETQLRSRGIRDQRVLDAMLAVPRHEFAPPQFEERAYGDHPLPIAENQTISQPYVVAAMLEALAIRAEDSVLEIGTGSGYQTALLAELARSVHSIDRHATLVEQARAVLNKLGYDNVALHVGDGSQGLPEAAPFDAIVVAAAAPQVPLPLFVQLREGGRMVIPVGSACRQELQLVRKQQGQMLISHLEGVRFVPLIGEEGFGPR
ncbi:MAG TPA: protein-L-isoaspartate(D-aspartate) O-methyltransferase [Terriglobales bacterium]|jgi:protein-L-isoaspartate(D-aspartate) O-methyltransferase|nr:protein-L-isoaspartate(D-aspartate) O-methyltransferase [Terriglobales bacterium]